MARTLRSKLTYANVMATIAVFIALGGSSYAAITITGKNVPRDALTGADIKALTGKDVRNNSLTGADVRALTSRDVTNGGLLAEDFAAGELPQGPQGPPGSDAQFDGAAAGGDLAGTYPNPAIAPGAVGPGELAGGAVTASKLADGSVVATKLGTVVVRTVTAAVNDNSNNSANAACNPGETAVGGGASLNAFAPDVPLISSRPADSGAFFELPANGTSYDAWRATAINPSGGTGAVSVRAHVLCLQP